MNTIKAVLIGMMTICSITPVWSHNEYYKLSGDQLVLTTDLSEAIKWASYSSLPLWLQFEEGNIPSELLLTDILDNFRGAFDQWAQEQYGCVSFTESDPDPNVFGDQIQINFTSSASVFEGSPAGTEYTGALTALCVSDNKFVVTAVNHQTQAPYTTILFNNSSSRIFYGVEGLSQVL